MSTRIAREASTGNRIPAHSLIGRAVVSVADGVKIGTVADLAIDAGERRVFGLVVTGGGRRLLVPFVGIRAIGADAITVEDAAGIAEPAGDGPGHALRHLTELTGLPVVSGDGVVLGRVGELELDGASGRVEALRVERGGYLGLGRTTTTVPAALIRGVGPKLLTVEPVPA
jgi:sporulation protein YlmC with PRC-barrel domain